MFPDLSPAAVPDVLRCLLEYPELRQVLQTLHQQNCQPCLELRVRLKYCETHLPASLLSYFHNLTKHPPAGCRTPLAIVTPDGRCLGCRGSIPTAWLPRIRLQTALYVCENCGAILLPVNPAIMEVCDAK